MAVFTSNPDFDIMTPIFHNIKVITVNITVYIYNQVTTVLFSDMIWSIRNQYKHTFEKIWILKYYKNNFLYIYYSLKKLCGNYLKNQLIICY